MKIALRPRQWSLDANSLGALNRIIRASEIPTRTGKVACATTCFFQPARGKAGHEGRKRSLFASAGATSAGQSPAAHYLMLDFLSYFLLYAGACGVNLEIEMRCAAAGMWILLG